MATVTWQEGPAELRADSLASWQGQEEVPGSLTLTGECPRCRTTFSTTVSGSAVINTSAAKGQAVFDAPTLFQCACSEGHAGRPATRMLGCGAFWVARPTLESGAARYHLEPVTQPQLVQAATLVAQDAQATATGLRSLAEKWIPGVAAITGILGLASVVVAADSVAGLSQGWRVAAYGLVAGAVVLAATATALVYRAAFGWPKDVPVKTEADLLAAAELIAGRNTRVANSLRTAVGLSFAALAALLIALGILWLQPDSTSPLKVTYTDAGGTVTLCGKLAAARDGTLRLEVTDGPRTTTESVPLASVTGLAEVESCGG